MTRTPTRPKPPGRPKTGQPIMAKRTFFLRPDQIEWLQPQENQSEIIRQALDAWREKMNQQNL